MKRSLAFIVLMSAAAGSCLAQGPGATNVLHRSYEEGEQLRYRMTAVSHKRGGTARLEAVAVAAVRQDEQDRFFEELRWTGFVRDGAPFELAASSRKFRQRLSLSSDAYLSIPDLTQIQPVLIGPVTDLLTIYADLWLAMRQHGLSEPGDHARVRHGESNTWADGTRIVRGEDAIDFEITLVDIDATAGIATVLVRHVPPDRPAIDMPAEWMRQQLAEAPNNWMQVVNIGKGRYLAMTGNETFDVKIDVDLDDGSILFAHMDNRIEVLERICTGMALSDCGDARRHAIVREVELADVRDPGGH